MATRWNLAVSSETDRSLRTHLAENGRAKKGELSRYVEDAVRDRLFADAVAEARAGVAHIPPDELDQIIDEAVDWARAQR